MDEGYIYIIKNPSFQNLLKIGQTIRSPEERAREISNATGVPSPYEVAYYIQVPRCVEAEALIHESLKDYRHSDNREFFNISINKAIDIIEKVALKLVEDEIPKQEELINELVNKEGEYLERLKRFKQRLLKRSLQYQEYEKAKDELSIQEEVEQAERGFRVVDKRRF